MTTLYDSAYDVAPSKSWWPRPRALQAGAEAFVVALALASCEPTVISWTTGLALAALGQILGWVVAGYGFSEGELRQAGPYRCVRHPRLLGAALSLAGVCFASRSALASGIGLALLTGVYFWRLRGREADLALVWGPKWVAYRDQVPAFLPQLVPAPAPHDPPRTFRLAQALPLGRRQDAAALLCMAAAFVAMAAAIRLADRHGLHIGLATCATLYLGGRQLYDRLGRRSRRPRGLPRR